MKLPRARDMAHIRHEGRVALLNLLKFYYMHKRVIKHKEFYVGNTGRPIQSREYSRCRASESAALPQTRLAC